MSTTFSCHEVDSHGSFRALLRSGRLPEDCTEQQLEAFAELLARRQGGSITGNPEEDLVLVAGYYSRACSSYECVDWLVFDLMPNWEADVLAQIEDEGAWHSRRNAVAA